VKRRWKRRPNKDKPRYGERLRHNIREMRKHAPFAKLKVFEKKLLGKEVLEKRDDEPESLSK
jgi:hypothetical protein